jgi:nucleotide-binding universal stress UspA family protein
MGRLHEILMATDFSLASMPAVREAIDVAKGADLLVLGTHGRTGLSRMLLGSVAARVIATAPCPVLTVRAA